MEQAVYNGNWEDRYILVRFHGLPSSTNRETQAAGVSKLYEPCNC